MDTRTVARTLSTLPRRASEARRIVLQSLLRVVEADHSLYFSVGAREDGSLALGHWIDVGRAAFPEARDAWERTILPGHYLALTGRLRPVETRTFLEANAVWPNGAFQKLTIYTAYFEPMGIDDQIRIIIERDGRHYGYVGLCSRRGTPGFTRHTRRKLAPLAPYVRDAIVMAQSLDDGVAPGDIVCTPDGHVEHASETGRVWLLHEGVAAVVREAVLRVDRGEDVTFLGGHRLRIVRLDGDSLRYLVQVAPMPLPFDPLGGLSAMQRNIARRAADGATIEQIARTLTRSPETIRSHMRDLYRRLSIRTRDELRERVRAEHVTPVRS